MLHCSVHVIINICVFVKMSIVPHKRLELLTLSHWCLKPACLPIPPTGYNHIRQAFYSQLRGIVSNLTRLTAVWVPEDMICDSAWIRTKDPKLRRFVLYPAELPNQFILYFLLYTCESENDNWDKLFLNFPIYGRS